MVGRDSVEPVMNDWPDINPFAANFDNYEARHHVGTDTEGRIVGRFCETPF
jgi:hypothetical protein